MIVVVAILALLLSLLAPTVIEAFSRTRTAICKNNLHELSKALVMDRGSKGAVRLPYASVWYRHVIEQGAGSVLKCPVDDGAMDFSNLDGSEMLSALDGFVGLADVYIVQNCVQFTNIEDCLAENSSPEDPQIRVNPPGIVGDHGWNPPDPGPNQDLICIDDDGAIMITYGDMITIRSLDPPGDGSACGSDHWIVVDDGSANWRSDIEAVLRTVRGTATSAADTPDSRVVMRLTGQHYKDILDPDYVAGGLRGSYGMSTAVHPMSPRPGQLMLVEYNRSVVRVSGDFTDLDVFLQPRHDGRANYALTDGHVDSMTIDDLELQFDGSTNRGIWGPDQ